MRDSSPGTYFFNDKTANATRPIHFSMNVEYLLSYEPNIHLHEVKPLLRNYQTEFYTMLVILLKKKKEEGVHETPRLL